jgi:mycofactocin precursor
MAESAAGQMARTTAGQEAGPDGASVAGSFADRSLDDGVEDLLVEEISIDGMCGVY